MGKVLPVSAIDFFSRFFPPIYISHIVGIKSIVTNNEIEGWFVACPLTPQRMLSLPPNVVYKKIINQFSTIFHVHVIDFSRLFGDS